MLRLLRQANCTEGIPVTINGGQPHAVGDRGQRYEVTFLDPGENVRKVFGWSETQKGAQTMVSSIEKHPSWQEPRIIDRKAEVRA